MLHFQVIDRIPKRVNFAEDFSSEIVLFTVKEVKTCHFNFIYWDWIQSWFTQLWRNCIWYNVCTCSWIIRCDFWQSARNQNSHETKPNICKTIWMWSHVKICRKQWAFPSDILMWKRVQRVGRWNVGAKSQWWVFANYALFWWGHSQVCSEHE